MSNSKDVDFLVRFICESDAIERIQDRPATVRTQIRRGSNRGHVGALLYLERCALNKEVLSESMIKETQFLIVSECNKRGHTLLKKGIAGSGVIVTFG